MPFDTRSRFVPSGASLGVLIDSPSWPSSALIHLAASPLSKQHTPTWGESAPNLINETSRRLRGRRSLARVTCVAPRQLGRFVRRHCTSFTPTNPSVALAPPPTQIVLNSMHKYQPRIHLLLYRGKEAHASLANGPISQLSEESCKTFIFSETIFTAVTAYQNHSVSTRTRTRDQHR